MKHTKGPCITVGPNDQSTQGRLVCIVPHDDKRRKDWFVVTGGEQHRESAENDARFIAAAFELVPELVDALKELLDVSQQSLKYDIATGLSTLDRAKENARTAIDKATD